MANLQSSRLENIAAELTENSNVKEIEQGILGLLKPYAPDKILAKSSFGYLGKHALLKIYHSLTTFKDKKQAIKEKDKKFFHELINRVQGTVPHYDSKQKIAEFINEKYKINLVENNNFTFVSIKFLGVVLNYITGTNFFVNPNNGSRYNAERVMR